MHKTSGLSSALLRQREFVAGRELYPRKVCRAGLSVTQRDRGAISWQIENRNYILHSAYCSSQRAEGLQIQGSPRFTLSIRLLQSLHLLVAPVRAGALGPSIVQPRDGRLGWGTCSPAVCGMSRICTLKMKPPVLPPDVCLQFGSVRRKA